jgi:hypothetical protein
MGDLQDTDGGRVYVPYFWPYELGVYPLKFRPDNYRPYIWNRYLHFKILKFPLIIDGSITKHM